MPLNYKTHNKLGRTKKVREIELKQVKVSEICKQYEVSSVSVYKWIEKYGMNKKKEDRLIVESESDTKQLLLLKKKVAELEQIIGQKQVLLDFKDKMIEIAEQTYGIAIKKKMFYPTVKHFWLNRGKYYFSMNQLYRSIGISKQSFHQKEDRWLKNKSEQEQLLLLIQCRLVNMGS